MRRVRDEALVARIAVVEPRQRVVDGGYQRRDLERQVVGRTNLRTGQPVTMVEDTTTTGGSLLKAIRMVEESGLVVNQVLTIVDREEGAVARLAEAGYALTALTTRTELLG